MTGSAIVVSLVVRDHAGCEIWDSPEQLAAFGERLMPILTAIGIEFSADPEISAVHNIVTRREGRRSP